MVKRKLLQRLLGGRSDANIRFSELRSLLLSLGFEERIQGSHHIYVREGVEEMINLQREGSKAKPYQVRQIRRMFVRYGLGDIEDA
jgi:predicted RNA binding protein YcfA (HicA-like mRNA interferase family)